jgi:thiamine biosynthesis lipoprotein
VIAIPSALWPSDLLPPRTGDLRFEIAGETMGTTWSVLCFAAPGGVVDALQRRIAAELDRLVLQMSHYREDSELARFNRANSGDWVSLSPEFFAVLRFSLDIANRSAGAFDPALGRQIDRWGFGPSGPILTPPAPLPETANGWRDILLDDSRCRAQQPGGVILNLSAVAKGFAVDHLATLCNAAGVHSYLIEIGGELRARGVKPGGLPWWVQVEPPPHSDLFARVALSGYSLATSGDYRRYFEHNGVRYSHTIHPASGSPVPNPPASVSVVHRDCVAADAWATALTVLGVERGLALCARERLAALFFHRLRDRWIASPSPAFQEFLDEY